MRYIIAIILFLSIVSIKANAQCACMGGAAIGGLTAIGGTANLGVLKEGYLRTNISGMYLYGDKFFGERTLDSGIVDYIETYYMNLSVGYGITNDLMIEADLGYFPNKIQSFHDQYIDSVFTSRGFSHIGITAKYNLYNSIMNEFEFTAGAGVRLPFEIDGSNLLYQQHVSASTGAYGINLHLFFHKGFKKQDIHLFLINRFDYNFENVRNYKYGSSLSTSFFVTTKIIENLSAYLELRNEFRDYDIISGFRHDNSGGNIISLSPQLNYSFYKFNLSAFFNYPLLQNFNGSQLGLNYSAGLNFTWQTKLF